MGGAMNKPKDNYNRMLALLRDNNGDIIKHIEKQDVINIVKKNPWLKEDGNFDMFRLMVTTLILIPMKVERGKGN